MNPGVLREEGGVRQSGERVGFLLFTREVLASPLGAFMIGPVPGRGVAAIGDVWAVLRRRTKSPKRALSRKYENSCYTGAQ
jgi:hypothetical protein